MANIRDFIYLDVERLYSLYSQVFEGVTERIIQSFIDGLQQKDSQKGPLLKGSDIETQIIEVSRRTENKFLFDHMYNRLEDKLRQAIITPHEVTPENYKEITRETVIKVSGRALIMDFGRIRSFAEQFNRLGEELAYITHHSSGMFRAEKGEIEDLESRLVELKDKNQRARIEKELQDRKKSYRKALEDLATQKGLHVDEQFMTDLSSVTEKLYYDRFELIIIPQADSKFGYRGILDKKWLRLQPDLLQALFGSHTTSALTMVGQITYAPEKQVEGESKPLTESDATPSDRSMRDAYEGLVDALHALEVITSESKKRVDLVLWPFAVYGERGSVAKDSDMAS
jgi:hypothetical protein